MGPSWGLGPAGGAESVRVCSHCSQSWGGLGMWGAQRVPWPQLLEPEIQKVSKAMSPAVPTSPAPTACTHPAPRPEETLEVGTQPWACLTPPQSSMPPPQSNSWKAGYFLAEWRAPLLYGSSGFPWTPAFHPSTCQASPWAVLPPTTRTPQTPEEPLRPRVPCGPTPGSHSVGASVEGVRC